MMKSPFRIVDLVTTNEDAKFGPAEQMTSAIIEIPRKGQECRPEDLKGIGFAPKDVEMYWHLAYSLASLEVSLMNGSD